ncbi:Lrp/AsnC family transcriptional regulator [Candidatus Bathyarchaeota archaeon]|nr:Lrp/AsnC family transcriptional regulator [Candidatus Bathyarchaeota archaeon]
MKHLTLIDELDKKIIQEMGRGINSYDALAQKCNVTRSTIYRRVNRLEETKIITRQTRVVPNFEKLNRIALAVGINVSQKNEQEVIDALKKCEDIKMMWRTYGAHNLILITFCGKVDEGNKINKLRAILEGFTVKSFDVCVGFGWEKMDMTPF